MGGTNFSADDYNLRSTYRSVNNIPTMAYDAAVKSGKAHGVHATLNPKGVKLREARDSDAHPISIPVGVVLDTTGSMQQVPEMIQAKLPNLMGEFLKERALGRNFLGEGYPAICIGAVDDVFAMRNSEGEGSLQIGQFESGLEIDDNITNLWLTGNGGGSGEESYDLALYFYARHTAADHWEKRHRKGHLIVIGDEALYPRTEVAAVKKVIGDALESNIPIEQVFQEVKRRWHVTFINPGMTSNYGASWVRESWQAYVGESFVELEDPNKICEAIVAAVAINEEEFSSGEILDSLNLSNSTALVRMGESKKLAKGYSGSGLPAAYGSGGSTGRL